MSSFVIFFLFWWFFCPCGKPGVGCYSFSCVGGGGCSDSESSRDVFSLVTVPEIHWLLSDLLAFPDTDDTILSFCHQSQGPFTLVEGRSSSFPNEPCVGPNALSGIVFWYLLYFLQATMDVSLSSFVGYSEKRAGQPVHAEADVLIYLRGFSGCDWLRFLMAIGENRIL